MNPTLLAEVALEVANYYPDCDMYQTRAMWRWHILDLAKIIIAELNLDEESEDLDELVENYFAQEESLS
jgi:hypothetical protein